ncbi:MAG: hypothetical protein RBT71_00145 [Flavobacteriales bacterium]|jgi:hypothetical protein|nr:hypothetical protein [Flavobacteriales bacterium]
MEHRSLILAAALLPVLLACGPRAGTDPALPTGQAGAPAPPQADTTPPPADGIQEITYPDGRVRMRGPLVDGRRHGLWTAYFPDGTVQSRGMYRNGLRHGTAEVFHPGGMPYYTGQYHQDNPSGEWLFHDTTGALLRTVVHDTLGRIIEQR